MGKKVVSVNDKIPLIDGKAIEASGGITPSGSISITKNDTYDVTEYAEAVVNVSGGGSGKTHKWEGDIEFTDVNTGQYITIPVDTTDFDYIALKLAIVKTGVIVDGEVVEDENLIIHSENSVVFNLIANTFPAETVTMYRNETGTTTTSLSEGSYSHSYYGRNFTDIGYSAIEGITSNGVTIKTGTNSRLFGRAGYYYKFHYVIYGYKEG